MKTQYGQKIFLKKTETRCETKSFLSFYCVCRRMYLTTVTEQTIIYYDDTECD